MRRMIALCLLMLAVLTAAVPAQAAPLPDLGASGPFRAGWTDVSITSADGRTFPARIYYPARRAGANTTINLAGAPYPVIGFAHGFIQPVSRYASTLRHLATWGFIVAAPWSEADLSPSHIQLAGDLSRSYTWLVAQNSTAGSRFAGAVDTERFGVSGHSMGGGASILAASYDPRVDAISNLAAAQTIPSAIDAISKITVPIQLIAGSEDIITPPANTQVPMYANANAPRQALTLNGGFHCGFLDRDDPIFCDTGSMGRTTQLTLTRRLLTTWFALYLKGNSALGSAVWGPEAFTDPQISLTADAGVTLTPTAQEGATPIGQPIRYTLTLTHTRLQEGAYQIEVLSQWPASSSLSQTQPLVAGEAVDFTVDVVPTSAGSQQARVVVRSLIDGGTTVVATLTTSAP